MTQEQAKALQAGDDVKLNKQVGCVVKTTSTRFVIHWNWGASETVIFDTKRGRKLIEHMTKVEVKS